MIAAQLDENNVVINRIIVDDLSVFPNLVDAGDSVIGATYDHETQTFTPPAVVAPVPDVVPMAAGRVAMSRAGVLNDVITAIQTGNGEGEIWWDTSDKIRRNFPLVETVRVALGWTESFVDDLFISAQNIENGG